MFCPKCGTKNPDDGKFCRSCGIDIGNVAKALETGSPNSMVLGFDRDLSDVFGTGCNTPTVRDDRKDPSEVYAEGVRSIITGVGFLVVSLALLFTGVAGGKAWWWAMLLPSFFAFAKGISEVLRSRKMERPLVVAPSQGLAQIGNAAETSTLPPVRGKYIYPDPRYKTGDLVPPSVTETTTRHLELDRENETMSLPKN